eukprot:Lankesteria_metandrocarpae@DN5029_c0_g1_i2.p2
MNQVSGVCRSATLFSQRGVASNAVSALVNHRRVVQNKKFGQRIGTKNAPAFRSSFPLQGYKTHHFIQFRMLSDGPAVKELNSTKELSNAVEDSVDRPAVFNFFARWCGPCATFRPEYEDIADDYGDSADFYLVDTEKMSDMAITLGITTVPTVLIYENGENVERFVGSTYGSQIRDALSEMLEDPLG